MHCDHVPIGINKGEHTSKRSVLRRLRDRHTLRYQCSMQRICIVGQEPQRYAPTKPLRLNAFDKQPGEWLIGFGRYPGDTTLSAIGSLEEAAANLFAMLHEADGQDVERIAVAPIPDAGLGAAINDRLRRAASDKGYPTAV